MLSYNLNPTEGIVITTIGLLLYLIPIAIKRILENNKRKKDDDLFKDIKKNCKK